MFKPFRGREGGGKLEGSDRTLLISPDKADPDAEPTTMRKPPVAGAASGADSAPRSPPVDSGQRARQGRVPGKDEATMLRPNVKLSRGDEHTMLRPMPQKPGAGDAAKAGPAPAPTPAAGAKPKTGARPLDATIAMTDGLILPAPTTAPLSPVQGGPRPPGGPAPGQGPGPGPALGPGRAPIPANVMAARTGTATPVVAVARPGTAHPKGTVGPLVAGGAAGALALAAIAFFIVRSHVKAEAAFHDPGASSATSSAAGQPTPLTLDMPTATDNGSLPPLTPPSAGTRPVQRWVPQQQQQQAQPPATVTAVATATTATATATQSIAQNQPPPPASASAAPTGSVDKDAKHLTDEADKELLDLLNRK